MDTRNQRDEKRSESQSQRMFSTQQGVGIILDKDGMRLVVEHDTKRAVSRVVLHDTRGKTKTMFEMSINNSTSQDDYLNRFKCYLDENLKPKTWYQRLVDYTSPWQKFHQLRIAHRVYQQLKDKTLTEAGIADYEWSARKYEQQFVGNQVFAGGEVGDMLLELAQGLFPHGEIARRYECAQFPMLLEQSVGNSC